jgi:HlyD family secretion protein
VIYSETIRAKLVYMVEARPTVEQAALINPGQPIAVRPDGGLVQTAQARRTARVGR